MAADKDLVLRLGSLTSHSYADLESDDIEPQTTPGQIYIATDSMGVRVFQYVRNRSGSTMAQGSCTMKVGDGAANATTTITNITAGSTTSATTSGLTAGDHQGALCFVTSNADAAGSAPEGEMSVVGNNTATVISMDGNLPFSVALAANDDLEIISNWQARASAATPVAGNCLGVVIGGDGISNGRYGWTQIYGPVACNSSGAIAENAAITAGSAVVVNASGGVENWIGYALAAATTGANKVPAMLSIFTQRIGTGTA